MTGSPREEELREDIERTRAQLGDTVEALAHKVDVSARVKDKMHDTKETVQVKAEEVTLQVLEGTAVLQAKAAEVAQEAERLIYQILEKLPPPVAARIEPLVLAAKQQPLVAAAVAVGVLLVLQRLLRRKR
ncbi:MAG: hypothetical protein DLM62_07295 [Pseudonocardiales bacterium]|nr:MAG: hypothetical protein DLM62_07295 [Pseudonocardiales bacterium]